VVVVVPGDHRKDRVQRHAAHREVDDGLLPVSGRELAGELERVDAALTERRERVADVVQEILALLRPAIGGDATAQRAQHVLEEIHTYGR
jgi:hypothetical protein